MLVTDLNRNGSLKKGKGRAVYSAEVKEYQLVLIKAGYNVGKYGADGKFGQDTDTATRLFQKNHGLGVDGKAGNLTLYELMWYKYPNFKKSELKCKCGGKYCNGFPVKVDERVLEMAQKVRDHFGKPVIITSGVRCTRHNKNEGGVAGSQHIYGKAIDFKVSGVTPSTVYAYVHTINPKGGVGRYNTFTHTDSRGVYKRFDYR